MLLCGLLFATVDGAGRLTGRNAGIDVSALSVRRDSLIQRRTRLAWRPLSSATRETEAPGSLQVATTFLTRLGYAYSAHIKCPLENKWTLS